MKLDDINIRVQGNSGRNQRTARRRVLRDNYVDREEDAKRDESYIQLENNELDTTTQHMIDRTRNDLSSFNNTERGAEESFVP